ncbi:MAG: carboxypeptidase-like regulatory domain-containing protein, partial [bacterium]|nr:carboxypeptidase-like regulatory domain-containing protein [bacterium]
DAFCLHTTHTLYLPRSMAHIVLTGNMGWPGAYDGRPARNQGAGFSLTTNAGSRLSHTLISGEGGEFTLLPGENTVLDRPSGRTAYDGSVEKIWKEQWRQPSAPWEEGGLPPRGYVRLSVLMYTNMGFDVGDIPWGKEDALVSLPPFGIIRGWVLDGETGRPVPGAGVGFFPGGPGQPLCRSDEQGMFSFTDVVSGRWTLYASDASFWGRCKDVELGEGEQVDVEIDLWKYYTFTGRVLDRETGQPVSALISFGGRTWVTEPDGSFAIAMDSDYYYATKPSFLIKPADGILSPTKRVFRPDPHLIELDLGDIYLEKEQQGAEAGPDL